MHLAGLHGEGDALENFLVGDGGAQAFDEN
jgi:hypothetical protein